MIIEFSKKSGDICRAYTKNPYLSDLELFLESHGLHEWESVFLSDYKSADFNNEWIYANNDVMIIIKKGKVYFNFKYENPISHKIFSKIIKDWRVFLRSMKATTKTYSL